MIAPEDRPKLFAQFVQVGDTFTNKPKGTGLGLPICKQDNGEALAASGRAFARTESGPNP